MRDAGSERMGNTEANDASPIGVTDTVPMNGAPATVPMNVPMNVPMSAHAGEHVGDTVAPRPSGVAMPDERARQNTPLWMETPAAQPEIRRGAPPPARSGLNTLLFFGLIVVVVGAAGIGGVALWGPEKPIKNRTQFATNPPAPTPLPSLSALAASPAIPDEVASAAAAPAEPAPAAEEAPSPKKGKKAPKTWKKRH